MHRKTIVASLMALFLLASICAFAASGDKAEAKGVITSRTGETLLVKSGNDTVTVVLTDDTTTKDDKGLFGLGKEQMSSVVLIPGLKVDVDGTSDEQGRVVARVITVDGDDLEAAEMIEAGVHPTAEQVRANVLKLGTHDAQIAQLQMAANRELELDPATRQRLEQSIRDSAEYSNRFNALAEYDIKSQATVKFDVGSSAISAGDQEQLRLLAQAATSLTGYIVEVTGYADATGNAEMNTKLSEDRAKAVVTYLMQQGSVPTRHIVAPGAMGEYGAVAPNETKAGRAENRRVEVKILVNKGIAGS